MDTSITGDYSDRQDETLAMLHKLIARLDQLEMRMISNNALETPTVSKRFTCKSVTCWNCGEVGHFAKGCATNFCTLPSQEATSTETINTAIQADESSEPIAGKTITLMSLY